MAKEPKKITKFEDVDTSALANEAKAKRAFKAVMGGAKGGSAEVALMFKCKAENPDISVDELVTEIYKGLGGLVDAGKAKLNREQDKKERAKRASR